MDIKTALATRKSIRAFTNQPVSIDVVKEILERAARAPSGSNLQPWRVHALVDRAREELIRRVYDRMEELPRGEGSEYPIHPANVHDEPYHSRYMRASELMYGAAGIERDDKIARQNHLAKNFSFFGAPVGLIFTIDRQMGPGQWLDLGMYLQSVMLLALDHGLQTCAQEAWALWPKLLKECLALPDNEMVVCGMAIGHADMTAPVNNFTSERAAFAEYVTVVAGSE